MHPKAKGRMSEESQRPIVTIKVYEETLRTIRAIQFAAQQAGSRKPSYADVVEHWQFESEERSNSGKEDRARSLAPEEDKVLAALERFARDSDVTERERRFVQEYLGLSAEEMKAFVRYRKKLHPRS